MVKTAFNFIEDHNFYNQFKRPNVSGHDYLSFTISCMRSIFKTRNLNNVVLLAVISSLLLISLIWNSSIGYENNKLDYYYEYDYEYENNNISSRVALVVIVNDLHNAHDYRLAFSSLRCYANVQNYHLYYINYEANETLRELCPNNDFFFTRHCVMAQLLQWAPNEYFVFLDADIGVINPKRRIEEFIDNFPKKDIFFYNRFYNDEIMAGSYIIKKSLNSLRFLKTWLKYEQRTMEEYLSGTDNAAVHSAIVEFYLPQFHEYREICEIQWKNARTWDGLFEYEACMQFIISKANFTNKGIHIYDKGMGWSRDGWITGTAWTEKDLFFHGWKKEKMGDEWILPFHNLRLFFETCKLGEFSRWKYTDEFQKSDTITMELWMKQIYHEKRRDYYERLKFLRMKGRFPKSLYGKTAN